MIVALSRPVNGEPINIDAVIIDGKRGTYRPWYAIPVHYRLCTVVAGANGDALFIQDLAEVKWMDLAH